MPKEERVRGTVGKFLAEKWMEGKRKQSPILQGDKSEFYPKTKYVFF